MRKRKRRNIIMARWKRLALVKKSGEIKSIKEKHVNRQKYRVGKNRVLKYSNIPIISAIF
jgi:sorbitol-specific phosphotransferase system component IIC